MMLTMVCFCHSYDSVCTWVVWPRSWKWCLRESVTDNRVMWVMPNVTLFNSIYLLWCLSLTCFVCMHFQQAPLSVISHLYELCCAVSFCTIFDNSCSVFFLLKVIKSGFTVFLTFLGKVLYAWRKCSLICSKGSVRSLIFKLLLYFPSQVELTNM